MNIDRGGNISVYWWGALYIIDSFEAHDQLTLKFPKSVHTTFSVTLDMNKWIN